MMHSKTSWDNILWWHVCMSRTCRVWLGHKLCHRTTRILLWSSCRLILCVCCQTVQAILWEWGHSSTWELDSSGGSPGWLLGQDIQDEGNQVEMPGIWFEKWGQKIQIQWGTFLQKLWWTVLAQPKRSVLRNSLKDRCSLPTHFLSKFNLPFNIKLIRIKWLQFYFI